MMILGLLLFLVGLAFLWWSIIPTIHDYWRMQSWQSVDGRLNHAELVSDADTYQVRAQYSYSVMGREFDSNRVAINSGSDNIGDFQELLGRRLVNLYDQDYPVTVYYNPDDPSDAVLNRDMRWGLLGFKTAFLLLFGGIGAGLIAWGYRGKKTIDSGEAAAKPWLSRPEWRNGIVYSDAKSGMISIWVFAAIWNLVSVPVALQVPTLWEDQGAVALLILLFPAVGLTVLFWAIKRTREWQRFGPTPLTLDPFPGAIGGDVGGEIRVKTPYRPDLICKVTLSSIFSYFSGTGKNRSRREKVNWQDDGYAKVIPQANALGLQFRFKIPPGLKETEPAASEYNFWRLNVVLPLEGPNLDRNFELPVFNTGQRSRHLNVDSSHERPPGVPELSAESLLPLQYHGSNRVIHYPVLRKPGLSLGLLVMGAVFAGLGYFLWPDQSESEIMLYLMAAVFNLTGWGTVLAAFYTAFNSLRISMDGYSISSVRSLFGIPISSHQYPYHEIQSVEAREGMSSNSGGKHTIEYSVIAKTRLDGKNIPLAEHLNSASKQKMVVEYFEKEFF